MAEQPAPRPVRGRPSLAPELRLTEVIMLRVTKSQAGVLEALGGQPWLRARIDAEIAATARREARTAASRGKDGAA